MILICSITTNYLSSDEIQRRVCCGPLLDIPKARDLPDLYFFHVSREKLDPESDRALQSLKNFASKQSRYLAIAKED